MRLAVDIGWKGCSPAMLKDQACPQHTMHSLLVTADTRNSWPGWMGSWGGGGELGRRWVAAVTSLILMDSGHTDGRSHVLCSEPRPLMLALMGF